MSIVDLKGGPLNKASDECELPLTMKALIKDEDQPGFKLKVIPVPQPKKGEVLVRTAYVGICGSDTLLYNWTEKAKLIAKLPFIPGHEASGTVVKIGPNCQKITEIGNRVAIENHFFCDDCELCEEGRPDICLNLNQFGHGKGTDQGGCAEFFTVPEKYCYSLSTDITLDQAALLEPCGVAHNACEQADVAHGREVLIIGCGAVGLFSVAIAKSMGATRIIAVDIVDDKLELATMMGADLTINPSSLLSSSLKQRIMEETQGIGVCRLIECSGNTQMVNDSFSMLRKNGTIVMVGLPKKPLMVENVIKDVIFKSLTLKTIHGRRIFKTWEQTEKLVNQGQINMSLVVSHIVNINDFEQGYQALLAGKAVKVLFKFE